MKFTRMNYLRYVEQLEREFSTTNSYKTIATPYLNKPCPSFDGGIRIEGLDYMAFFDCVLSDYEYEGVAWMTYVSLYNDEGKYVKAWKVDCYTMEMFKILVNSVCKQEKFANVVTLLEGSDYCEG